nr:hypothetical protein Ade03nite_21850 [Actinoplanes derwentensis]
MTQKQLLIWEKRPHCNYGRLSQPGRLRDSRVAGDAEHIDSVYTGGGGREETISFGALQKPPEKMPCRPVIHVVG